MSNSIWQSSEEPQPVEQLDFTSRNWTAGRTYHSTASISGDGITAEEAVGAFARFLVAVGYSPVNVDDLIPRWRDLG